MSKRTLLLICDPETRDPLELDTGALLNPKSGRRYPIRDGIPIFFEVSETLLGEKGLEVSKALAAELKLEQPRLPWHAHRDRFAEVLTSRA